MYNFAKQTVIIVVFFLSSITQKFENFFASINFTNPYVVLFLKSK